MYHDEDGDTDKVGDCYFFSLFNKIYLVIIH